MIKLYELITYKVSLKEGAYDTFRGPRLASRRNPAAPLTAGNDKHRAAPRQTSTEVISQPSSARTLRQTDDDSTEAPSDVEVRIAELSLKIDRLTALVVALQPGAGIEETRT